MEKGTAINNLPDECLQEIFSRVADSSASPRLVMRRTRYLFDNHHGIRHPLQCAVVCKRWQAAVDPAITSLCLDITAPAAETVIQHTPRFVHLTRVTVAFQSRLSSTNVADLFLALAANTPQLEQLILLEPSYRRHLEYPKSLAMALTHCLPVWTRLRNLTLGRLPGESKEESLALLDLLRQVMSLRELDMNVVGTEVPLDSVCERLVRLTGVAVIKMRTADAPPPSMTALTTLKELNLFFVLYEHLPDTLGALRSLTGLNLDLVSVLDLPDSIDSLTALRRLVLKAVRRLTTLPGSMGNLKALNELKIHRCPDLKKLPDSLGNLHALRYLSIRHSSKLSELPASIGELRQLTHLAVFGGSFRRLPDSVSQLRELTLLALGGSSELRLLPCNIGALGNLRVLDILSCPLQELPASVCQLARLSRLTASHCSELKSLPLHIGRLQALKELHLQGNSELDILPDGIADLRSLTTLNVSNCPKLRRLPERVADLTRFVDGHCI